MNTTILEPFLNRSLALAIPPRLSRRAGASMNLITILKRRKFVSKKKNNTYEVDISKLHDGKVYKNYKAFVLDLGWKYYRSKTAAGQAQKKQLDAVCRWGYECDEAGRKISNKVIIHEVYKEAKQVVDKRKYREGELLSRLVGRAILECIQNGSLLTLAEQPHLEPQSDFAYRDIYLTQGSLYVRTGLVNPSYVVSKHNRLELAKQENVSMARVNDFFACNQVYLKRILGQALAQLKNRRLVDHLETFCLVLKEADVNTFTIEQLHEKSSVDIHVKEKRVFANDHQRSFIFACEANVLKKYGYQNFSDVYSCSFDERDAFFKEIVSVIRQEAKDHPSEEIQSLSSLQYYYSALKLTFVPRLVEQEVKEYGKLTVDEKEILSGCLADHLYEQFEAIGEGDTKEKVNQVNLKRIQDNAKNRHQRAKKNQSKKDLMYQRMNEDYVAEMMKLSGDVISLDSEFKIQAKLTKSEVINLNFKQK